MSPLVEAVWIGLLGAVGCLLRAGAGGLLGRWLGPTADGVAWAPTLVVNLVGSFVMGIVMGWATAAGRAAPLPVTAGLLGGFTTYSAFAYQSVALAERRAFAALAGYLSLTLVGCLAACAAGLWLGARARG